MGDHKAWHDYRVIEQLATPVYCPDWGIDEELLLIDGCQLYGLGNWADIADHIGNRTKDEVERHFVEVYIEGRNGLPSGDERAEKAVAEWRAEHPSDPDYRGEERLPIVGPDTTFHMDISTEEVQQARRERIEQLHAAQAAFVAPKPNAKPLVSAPTTHSELAGFMPGRLEFEHEYEQDAEHLVKDMEFGLVYSFGGNQLPDEHEALGSAGATQGQTRMEASGRGGPVQAPTTVEDDKASQVAAEANGAASALVDEPAEAAASPATAAPAAEQETLAERAPDWDEDPNDLELKLMVLDMYSDLLDRRQQKKAFLFERNLVDYRRIVAGERRRPKEERDLLARIKHFATMQTAADFEELYHNLCYEEALKRTVRQLQHYRRMGITTFAEAARYDKEAAERTKRQLEAAEGSLSGLSGGNAAVAGGSGAHAGRVRHRERSVSSADNARDGDAFSFATAPGIQLLTRDEQQLCSALHILPEPFLMLKTALLTYGYMHCGALTRERCEQLFRHISPRKMARVYQFFHERGYLGAVGAAAEAPAACSKRQRDEEHWEPAKKVAEGA